MAKLVKTRQRGGGKSLRDTQIMSMAMRGMTVSDIAKDLSMSRQAVSEILNSDDMRAKVVAIEGKLAQGLDDAVKTVLEAVKKDYWAARDLLRAFGTMNPGKVGVTVERAMTLEELLQGSYGDTESDLD